MIRRVQLVRNIGKFASVTVPANLPLARLTLIYAENGRGKTTLAAILRSLASGSPIPTRSGCAIRSRGRAGLARQARRCDRVRGVVGFTRTSA